MKDKLKQRKILIIVLAVILTLSVGYAIFSESLNIKGSASTGSTNFNIVFDRVGSIKEVEASGTTADIKESGKKLEINVPGLSMPTAYAIIPVTIKNKGEITAKVKEIRTEGLDTTDIKVTYEGLAKEDIFNPNDEKEVNIKVIWDASSTSTNVEASFSIEIVYEQVASGSVTTTTSVVDSRFVYEGTKLMGLSAEGEEYFKTNKELIIPEGTTEIADGAFFVPYGYEGEVPDFDRLINLMEKCGIYNNCTEDETSESALLNDKLTLIMEYNQTNNRLKDVTIKIPSGVKRIGHSAFAALGLTGNLEIPNSVTEIGGVAFGANLFSGNLNLPSNLKIIGAQSFTMNKFSGNLIIPDSVTKIGGAAFMGNSFNGDLTLGSNLKMIQTSAFSSNQFTGDLVIPNSVVELGGSSFDSSGFTGTLTLPNGITNIGKRAFYGTGFTGELYIPDNITDINYGAFYDCKNITSVSMPSSTTYKEVASAFDNPSFPSGVPINKR